MSTIDLRLKNLQTNPRSFSRNLNLSHPVHLFIPLPPPNHPDLLKQHNQIKSKSAKHLNQLSARIISKQSKTLQQRCENTNLSNKQSNTSQTGFKINSGSDKLARVRDLTRLTDLSSTRPEINLQITKTTTTNTHLSNPKISSILHKEYKYPQTNIFTWVKPVIPKPPPNLEEVERKLYPYRFKIVVEDVSTLLRIPTPPPHMPESMAFPCLELIPSPPPNIPECLLSHPEVSNLHVRTSKVPDPIRGLIPHPPPDIPPHLLESAPVPQIAFATARTPNPIMSIIPPPPPDIPISPPPPLPPVNTSEFHSLHLQEIVNAARLREEERKTKIKVGSANFHEIHLREIVLAARRREEEMKTKQEVSSKSANFPPPPPVNSSEFRAIHLQEVVNARLREVERETKVKVGESSKSANVPVDIVDSFDSSDSWDDSPLSPPPPPLPPVNTSEFHSMHLQEIVNAARLREEERKTKVKVGSADFHEIHLREIVLAARRREEEMKTKQEVSSDSAIFRELHLQEIVGAAKVREEERIANAHKEKHSKNTNFPQLRLEDFMKELLKREKVGESRAKRTSHVTHTQELSQQSTQFIALHIPNLKKETYYLRLISELGLTEKGDGYIPSYSEADIANKRDLLCKIEQALSVGHPSINSLLPLSLIHVLEVSNYPDFANHHSHMSRHLTPEIYQLLSKRVTNSGFTLDQAIQTGVDNTGDSDAVSLTVGCVAGDEDSYVKFAELFDLVIETVHNGYSIDKVHYSDFDPIHFSDGYFDPNYVLSCRVRAGRSVRGFPFLPQCTRSQRRKVESIVRLCLNDMPHPFKGTYHSISTLSVEDHGYLSSRGLLFHKPTSPLVISSGMNRDWPDARGLWVSRDESFFAWVNETDHVRLVSMAEGGDLSAVFERFCLGVQLFEMVLNLSSHELMKNRHLGYILTCPSNLGTGMKVSLRVKIPIVSSLPEFSIIIEYLHLEKRDTFELGIFDISNKHSLGYTEVGLVQEVINSIQLLIRIERALWSGYPLLETVRENKPGLADVLIAGVCPLDPFSRIKCDRKLIPKPPPNMPQI